MGATGEGRVNRINSNAVYLCTYDKLGCTSTGSTFTNLALFSLLICRGNDKLLHVPYSTESLASFSTQNSQYRKLKLNCSSRLGVFAVLVASASHNHLLIVEVTGYSAYRAHWLHYTMKEWDFRVITFVFFSFFGLFPCIYAFLPGVAMTVKCQGHYGLIMQYLKNAWGNYFETIQISTQV